MKTTKYFIKFANIETDMSTMIEISKTEYEKQFNFLLGQTTATEEEEYPMSHRQYEAEFKAYIEYEDYFTVACADTILCKQVCKEGYRFKTKNEMRG